jgi:DNA polymerase-3 subunit epsilon
MSDTFVAIDFETADPEPDSACAIGLVRVEAGQIVRREVALIRPPRSRVAFSHIHGITWEKVRDAPTFARVWPSLVPVLDGADHLVAHNASFDRRVMEACCRTGGLTPPGLPWVCTLTLAKKKWPKPHRNGLVDVCVRLGIPMTAHHEALADAEACAKVLIALALEGGVEIAPEAPKPRKRQPDASRERAAAIRAVLDRATTVSRRVYGFDSLTGRTGEVLRGRVPPEWDRLCVEGDIEWTAIPRDERELEEPEPVEPPPSLFASEN